MAEVVLSPIRELTDHELSNLNQLVSDAFGYQFPHRFFDDFPIWKSDQVRRFGIFSGDQLVAHAGIRYCDMHDLNGKKIPISMIGAVATDEQFRGKGLSSRILEHLCKLSEENHCDWTVLWGAEHDFYRRFGFELQGDQFQGALQDLENLPENSIPRIKRGWDERIFDSLSKEKSGIMLRPEDRDWMSNHPTVNWFYQEDPFAFIGYERGLDLPHMIHEFGGDQKGIKLLFAYLLSLDSEATVLGTKSKLVSLGFQEDHLQDEFLCLARPHSAKPDLEWKDWFWVQGLSAC